MHKPERMDSLELCLCWELNSRPLEVQQMLPITKASGLKEGIDLEHRDTMGSTVTVSYIYVMCFHLTECTYLVLKVRAGEMAEGIPEFDPWDPRVGRREAVLTSCPLVPPTHTCIDPYTDTQM